MLGPLWKYWYYSASFAHLGVDIIGLVFTLWPYVSRYTMPDPERQFTPSDELVSLHEGVDLAGEPAGKFYVMHVLVFTTFQAFGL